MSPYHASSHLLMANLQAEKAQRVPAILSSQYFLLLEPNSARTESVLTIMKNSFRGDVERDADNPDNINISLSADIDDEFGFAELTLSLLGASRYIEENENKSELELFTESATTFFGILEGDPSDSRKKSIWWEFYIPFYSKLSSSDFMPAYCAYILKSEDDEAIQRLKENDSNVNEFFDWLNETNRKEVVLSILSSTSPTTGLVPKVSAGCFLWLRSRDSPSVASLSAPSLPILLMH